MENIENSKKVNKSNHKKTKIVIKNKNKLYRAIGIFVAIVVLIVIIICSNSDITIDNDTDMSKVNIKKHSEEIKLYYDGLMNDFIVEYNNVQNISWTYIYNNMIDGKTMEVLISEVNQVLSSDDWSVIGMNKNTKWRGTYRIDANTNALLFKFETKEIEPTWITDSSVNYMIEVN